MRQQVDEQSLKMKFYLRHVLLEVDGREKEEGGLRWRLGEMEKGGNGSARNTLNPQGK